MVWLRRLLGRTLQSWRCSRPRCSHAMEFTCCASPAPDAASIIIVPWTLMPAALSKPCRSSACEAASIISWLNRFFPLRYHQREGLFVAMTAIGM